ncbi:MAG: hypothetical protein ACQEUZ_09900 [Pseudomonadota bacterium]
MTKRKTESESAPAKSYEPTPREREVMERLLEHREKSPNMELKAEGGGKATLEVTHENQTAGRAVLLDALGSREMAFLEPFLAQLVNAVSKGSEADAAAGNFLLAVVKDAEPRDQMEAMLAAQMGAVHMAMMQASRRLTNAEMLPQHDSALKAMDKLARTYAQQMEALKRYRTGGEQKVTVQHVTVNDGGQAVVGNVRRGGGDGTA